MSQRRGNRSREEVEDLTGLQDSIKECVRFITCREASKIPIKQTEITNHLKTVCQTPTNQINTVILEADKILKKVYGYKLLKVDASGIQYIVILNEETDAPLSSVVNKQHRKILIAALMHIYMSGAPVKEEDMWKFLMEAGLMEELDKATRDLLKIHFKRQMYLQYSKIGEGDLARYMFAWGQRASAEVPKMFLLKKMAEKWWKHDKWERDKDNRDYDKAFNKTPDHWCEQFDEANQEEKDRS